VKERVVTIATDISRNIVSLCVFQDVWNTSPVLANMGISEPVVVGAPAAAAAPAGAVCACVARRGANLLLHYLIVHIRATALRRIQLWRSLLRQSSRYEFTFARAPPRHLSRVARSQAPAPVLDADAAMGAGGAGAGGSGAGGAGAQRKRRAGARADGDDAAAGAPEPVENKSQRGRPRIARKWG
jgi:hypothetical protein